MSMKSNGYKNRIRQELITIEQQLADAQAELPDAYARYMSLRDAYMERENTQKNSASIRSHEEIRADASPM